MNVKKLSPVLFLLLFGSCASNPDKDTIGQLHDVKIDLSDVKIEGGLEKAMQSYQKFLEQTPESAMAPEALRRLADLKIQKEYGTLAGVNANEAKAKIAESTSVVTPPAIESAKAAPAPSTEPGVAAIALAPATESKADKKAAKSKKQKTKPKGKGQESTDEFEKRATKTATIKPAVNPPLQTPAGPAADLQNAGAVEAIALYKKLLAKYPNYDRNDQVLYQLSRAYEETGQVEEAMNVMNRIVKDFPQSRYFDEVQFRRGEYFFTRKKFLDSEDAFKSIVDRGEGSSYFELALYKLGWSIYKQELYEDAMHRFVALLDYKAKAGVDFDHLKDNVDDKRVDDTFRVISLGFSYLGGADAVEAYFAKNGKRNYEVNIYSNLGEYYLDKLRYSDAAATYKAFVKSNPYHKVAPHFDTRVIEIYKKGGFPKLVIEANKEFVVKYGLKSEYWKYYDVKAYPQVIGYVKTSLKELANHYHSLYQEKKFEKDKPENFQEAMKWYREFLKSFPKEPESPGIHYQLSELLLENKSFADAAVDFEHTAYDYPYHEKAPDSGYAAVYAYREYMNLASPDDKIRIRKDVIRSSLKFSDAFPKHEKAALVMSAALDDIYTQRDFEFAVKTGRKLLNNFPSATAQIMKSAWLVIAHSSFELANYEDAEEGYQHVLQLMAENDKTRPDVVENLAASIYKQGERASKLGDHKTAAMHFLRVAKAAPTSKIRISADYDGATALMQLKDWDRAAEVLLSFRSNYPGNKLQPDVTKKIAFVYKEAGKLALAAAEYERIETESQDQAVRREALQLAADLYVDAKETDKAMQVYRRYVNYFPKPLEPALETRNKIANVLKSRNEMGPYFDELKQIVAADAKAGSERTDRTRYLAASASLVLTEPLFKQCVEIRLVKPFDKNLKLKKAALKTAKDAFEKLLQYEVGDVTAASTYYIGELYYDFSRSLMESERPDDLSAMEKEQYELALEDQAYPFEEKAIQIHAKNMELLPLGIYNSWIENSLEKLAKLVPARYAKPEESSGFISRLENADYTALTEPAPVVIVPVPAVQPQSAVFATEPAVQTPQPSAEPASAPVAVPVQAAGAVEAKPKANAKTAGKKKKVKK